MTIDNAGFVGIGNSSPAYPLHVEGAAKVQLTGGAASADFDITSGTTWRFRSNPTTGTNSYGLDIVKGSAGTDVKMSIDASGNVGISNGIPSSFNAGANNLVIGSGSGSEGMTIYGGAESNIFFADGTVGSAAYTGRIEYSHTSDSMKFYVNNSNAMTIDDSGFVVIGASVRSAQNSLTISQTGYVQTRVTGTAGYFDRLGSDGTVIELRKDGVAIGSVGVDSTRLTIGSASASGLRFDGANVMPTSSGSLSDGTVDIGYSANRFKDLHLSGNASMGSLSPGIVTISTGSYFIGNATNGYRFNNAADTSNLMVLKDDGNLLVGKTATALATAGLTLGGAGFASLTRSGAEPLNVNRLSSDGDLAVFYKDSVAVGSVATNGGRLSIGSGDVNLNFNASANSIYPISDTAGTLSDGVVDLGAASARLKDLHLFGTANVAGVTSSGQIKVTGSNASTVALSVGDTGTGFYNAGGNVLGISASGSEAARFDSTGAFYVGTTTTGSNVATGFTIQNPAGATYTTLGHANATATGAAYTVFSYNSGTIGSITQSGTTAVLFNTTSDQRAKENISDADDAGRKIDSIQVRKFDWKADGSHQDYGMVAQELQAVAPEAVSGDADSEDMMSVDYSKLVPMLIKEIQSLRQRVAQLEE